MNHSKSIVFEHFDLKEIFVKKILPQSSTFDSFEDYEIGSEAYHRVWNHLFSVFMFDVMSQMSNSHVKNMRLLPGVISVNDRSS